MGARDEIVGVENEESAAVVDDTSAVCEMSDDINEVVWFHMGGDPVSS